MKKRMLYFCFGITFIGACKQQVLENNIDYQPFIPKNFPTPIYDLTTNPISKEGFELGRKLFYDPILSLDSTISCGNCHQQSAGFTQHGHDISHGFKDRLGTRNAQPIMNLLWNQTFFWDGGVHQLDFVPINAITSPVEMERALQRAALEARLKPMVEHQFAKHRRQAQWRYNLKLAAGVLLFGLFSSSIYTRWMPKPPIPIETGYGAAAHTLDAVITTQLDTFEALQTQLKKVVHSLRDENLESNLLKIKQLPNESQDLIPYFEALAYLKAGQLPIAKDLLNGIIQLSNHPKKKEALSLLETMQ